MMTPPPMPVPTKIATMFLAPRPAPSTCSPTAPALTSLSRTTGECKSWLRFLARGYSVQFRLGRASAIGQNLSFGIECHDHQAAPAQIHTDHEIIDLCHCHPLPPSDP